MKNTLQAENWLSRMRLPAARAALALAAVLLLVVTASQSAQAQTYEVLHRFHHGKADGAFPEAGVVRDAPGNLYGTTRSGGSSDAGVVFKLSPTGKETVLHNFTGGADGGWPEAGLIRDAAGNLYGTTVSGGSSSGVVFKLDTTGKETVLHTFTGGTDGGSPGAGVLQDAAGNLYGTTGEGGDLNCYDPFGCGVVFKLDITGKETVLHTFTGGTDGGTPGAGVLRDDTGNLYGTTYEGGDLNCTGGLGCGVVFKVDTTGKETVLHTFTGGTDGGSPGASVLRDAAGNLYGTTGGGGTYGYGVVFKLSPTTRKLTVLYTFTGGADGSNPYAGVVRDAPGNLYGTTDRGGTYGSGVVFKLDITGKETVLHTFTGGTDGANPFAGLLRDNAGNLYGTTHEGGDLTCDPPYGCGVVFKLTP